MYRKIKRKIDSIGVINTVLFIVRHLYNTIFNSGNLLFRCGLLNYDFHNKYVNKEVKIIEKKYFRDITNSEKMTLREYGGAQILSNFEHKLKKGNRLFLAYIHEEIAGACWVYVGGENKFYIIPLSEKEFMCFSNFTIHKFRRVGVSTTLFIEILNTMKIEGYHQGFVFIKEWNFNQKAVTKAGFQFVGKFHEVRLLNRNIVIWTGNPSDGYS